MKLLILLGFIYLINASAPTWKQLDDSYKFEHYEGHFDKVYNSQEERNFREIVFNYKLKEILTHNADPTKTWKMGVNQFTDRTDQELDAFLGLNKGLLHQTKSKMTQRPVKDIDVSALPTSVDWRGKGVLTAVKDQGKCGSCWAFASTEGIESMWAQATGQLVQLSEQNILDCTPNPNHCGGKGGCEGGIAELAFDMVKEHGISSEWVYPYISYNGKDFNCTRQQPIAHLTGYVNLAVNKKEPVMEALANVGPLVISVDAAKWFLYEGGVFDGCNQATPDLDHLVQLVGYGTDDKLGDYWIVRNSWSPNWGEDGFIRLRRTEQPRCGTDVTPQDGDGCDNGPSTVEVCGTCGVLYDALYPTYSK